MSPPPRPSASDEDIERALLWWGTPRVTHLLDPTDPQQTKALSFVLVDKPTEYSGTHAGAGKGVTRGVRLTDESPLSCLLPEHEAGNGCAAQDQDGQKPSRPLQPQD